MPCRLISFLAAHEALLAGLSAGVCFCIGVAAGVTGIWLVRVLLAVMAVHKVDIRVYLQILNIHGKGLSAA